MKKLDVLWCVIFLGLSAQAIAGDPANGAKVYQQHCVACHGPTGRATAPGVPDFSIGQGLAKPDLTLAESIKRGKALMPAFLGLVVDNDIMDAISYIRTLH